MSQQDHLGRELDASTEQPATVTQFAVEQGTLDGSDPGVQETIAEEEKRAEAGTERAERMSEQLSPAPAEEEREQETRQE